MGVTILFIPAEVGTVSILTDHSGFECLSHPNITDPMPEALEGIVHIYLKTSCSIA